MPVSRGFLLTRWTSGSTADAGDQKVDRASLVDSKIPSIDQQTCRNHSSARHQQHVTDPSRPRNLHHKNDHTPSFIRVYQICQQKWSRNDLMHLREHAGAARLDSLDLSLAPGQATEARGELDTVKEFTSRRANGAKRGTRLTADTGVELGATERAVLLSLGAVGSERVREDTGGRGRMNVGSVVHGLCESLLASCVDCWGQTERSLTGDGALADEADQGSPSSVTQSEGGTHCDGGGRCCGTKVVQVNFTESVRNPRVREDPDRPDLREARLMRWRYNGMG